MTKAIRRTIILFLVAAAIVVAVWFRAQSPSAVSPPAETIEVQKDAKKTSVKSLEKIEISPLPASPGKQELDGPSSQKIVEEFKKCFNQELKSESFDNVKNILLKQKDYSAPIVSEESYDLIGPNQEDLVVQHIPQEEDFNKVRVFSISKEDGLPDRVKDFPQAKAEPALRLKGALSLGSLKSHTVSTTQTAYDQSSISIDTRNNQVVRIHLMTRSFDFECRKQSCLCLKKE